MRSSPTARRARAWRAPLPSDPVAYAAARAPVRWQVLEALPTPAPLPEGAEPLSRHVKAPAALGRRLGQTGVVVAGRAGSEQATGTVGVIRGDTALSATVTTVDNVDSASGRVAAVLGLMRQGGLDAVPWNLVLYTVPGAVIGGQIGARFQGRISSETTERFIAILFAVVGIAFLATILLG